MRAILIMETDTARLFRVVDREVWIPKSVVKSITKFKPDAKGERECIMHVEDWWEEKHLT
jgi:hypothetical protein